jgi:signal recognition particle subunit SRP54
MGGGFLGKLPGFKQLNTMRQLKDMDIGALFGDMMGAQGGGAPGGPGGPGGGLMGMPGFGGLNLPPGYTPPGQRMKPQGNGGTKSKSMSRSKRKRKSKMAKKARKK